jgi:hypothetical protein
MPFRCNIEIFIACSLVVLEYGSRLIVSHTVSGKFPTHAAGRFPPGTATV